MSRIKKKCHQEVIVETFMLESMHCIDEMRKYRFVNSPISGKYIFPAGNSKTREAFGKMSQRIFEETVSSSLWLVHTSEAFAHVHISLIVGTYIVLYSATVFYS